MEDFQIIELYWSRKEEAIQETEALSELWVFRPCQRFKFCRKFNISTKSEFDRISKHEKEPKRIRNMENCFLIFLII